MEVLYKKRCEMYPEIMSDVDAKIQMLDEKFQEILKYIYSTVSVADIAEVDFSVYLDYAVHNRMLREQYNRVSELPEDLFFQYVVNPRVADEEIDVCRSAFYYLFIKYLESEEKFWNKDKAVMEIKMLPVEKTDRELADEVNFWCAAEAGLEESGERTVSAKTVFASAKGNAVELAVFFVHALRSVGIPAKMGNFAVESAQMKVMAYLDGKWCEMKVCEPWYGVIDNLSDEGLKKRWVARKARSQGNQFVKVKRWRNEEREKFFFGDMFTMSVRAKLLKEMSEKDQQDMRYEVMEEHFRESYPNSSDIEEDLYISYVLNPRIAQEVIFPWRKIIKEFWDEETRNSFRQNPMLIWKEIETEFGKITEEEIGKRNVSPMTSLKLKKVSPLSAKILFVAIARSCFVPAKFNADINEVQYWNGEKFVGVVEKQGE